MTPLRSLLITSHLLSWWVIGLILVYDPDHYITLIGAGLVLLSTAPAAWGR